jgi:hypothetical protein
MRGCPWFHPELPATNGVSVASALRMNRSALRDLRHILESVVLFAEGAFPSAGIAAGQERVYPMMNELVVGSIGADNQVAPSVVVAISIDVMHNRFWWQGASEGCLCDRPVYPHTANPNALDDVPAPVAVAPIDARAFTPKEPANRLPTNAEVNGSGFASIPCQHVLTDRILTRVHPELPVFQLVLVRACGQSEAT